MCLMSLSCPSPPLYRFRRYWLQVLNAPAYSFLRMGCGVTAIDQNDALALARRALASILPDPVFGTLSEDIDVRTLDPHHILPNMGDCSTRGVWFPRV